MLSLHNSSFECVLSTKHHLPIPPNGLGPVKSSPVFMEILSMLSVLKHVNKTILASSVGRNNRLQWGLKRTRQKSKQAQYGLKNNR